MMFLFGFGKKQSAVVITRSVYETKRRTDSLFDLVQKLSPRGQRKICTTFQSPEPFLTYVELKGKDKERSRELMDKLIISSDQADEITLAKKLNCLLLITNQQLWLTDAAKKAGVKTKVFR